MFPVSDLLWYFFFAGEVEGGGPEGGRGCGLGRPPREGLHHGRLPPALHRAHGGRGGGGGGGRGRGGRAQRGERGGGDGGGGGGRVAGEGQPGPDLGHLDGRGRGLRTAFHSVNWYYPLVRERLQK